MFGAVASRRKSGGKQGSKRPETGDKQRTNRRRAAAPHDRRRDVQDQEIARGPPGRPQTQSRSSITRFPTLQISPDRGGIAEEWGRLTASLAAGMVFQNASDGRAARSQQRSMGRASAPKGEDPWGPNASAAALPHCWKSILAPRIAAWPNSRRHRTAA